MLFFMNSAILSAKSPTLNVHKRIVQSIIYDFTELILGRAISFFHSFPLGSQYPCSPSNASFFPIGFKPNYFKQKILFLLELSISWDCKPMVPYKSHTSQIDLNQCWNNGSYYLRLLRINCSVTLSSKWLTLLML